MHCTNTFFYAHMRIRSGRVPGIQAPRGTQVRLPERQHALTCLSNHASGDFWSASRSIASEQQGRPIGRRLDDVFRPVLPWMLHSVKCSPRLVVLSADGRMLPRLPLDVDSSLAHCVTCRVRRGCSDCVERRDGLHIVHEGLICVGEDLIRVPGVDLEQTTLKLRQFFLISKNLFIRHVRRCVQLTAVHLRRACGDPSVLMSWWGV